MSLETSYYPHCLCTDLASLNLTNQSVYRLLETSCGVVPDYATDTIELSVAGAYEAKEL
jgi:DNA-binding GntR family transcriptional regulator